MQAIGRSLGTLIYIMGASADREEDAKRGRCNSLQGTSRVEAELRKHLGDFLRAAYGCYSLPQISSMSR